MCKLFGYGSIFCFLCLPVNVAFAGSPTDKPQDNSNLSAEILELEPVIVHARENKSASGLLKEHQLILDEQILEKQNTTSLGELLSKQPGIHNQSYGVNSGKPVIRSLTGSRVQILNNQMPSSEAANISNQLSTGISPHSAKEVQVLSQGAAILYGGGAIGGAINVKDHVIANQYYAKPEGSIGVQTSLDNGSEEYRLELSGSLFENLSWSLSGFNYYRPDVKIAGNAKADLCYELGAPETGLSVVVQDLCQVKIPHQVAGYDYQKRRYIYKLGEPIDLTPNQKGRLTNSKSQRQSAKAGLSYLLKEGLIGISFTQNENHYGVPFYALINNKTGEKSLAPVATYGIEKRVHLHSNYHVNVPFLSYVELDATQLKAHNSELLGKQVMSDFIEQQDYARLSLSHQLAPPVSGSIGLSFKRNHIDTQGKDRYLPDMQSEQKSFFWLEKFYLNQSSITFGFRQESLAYENKEKGKFTPLRHGSPTIKEREFNTSNHFVNAMIVLHPSVSLSITHSQLERAPAVHELYANGNHYAILTAEAGDDTLKAEQAIKNEVGLKLRFRSVNVSLAQYEIDYANYIYLAHTGIFDEYTNLYKKAWRQSDNKLSGYEVQGTYYFALPAWGDFELSALVDLVKNYPAKPNRMQKHSEGEFLPGLPTSRTGAALAYSYAQFRTHIEGVHYFVQKHRGNVINPEPELPAYTLVDARIGYDFYLPQEQKIHLYMQGFNLLNQAARAYNSPIKYLAPSAGRSVVMGFDYSF